MGDPAAACPEPADSHVGRKAVELGLLTEMQLHDVLARLASAPPAANESPSLSAALVRFGLLTQRQLDALRDDTAAIRKKFGKYRIVRQLGKGGMGVVYEAIDADLGRTVALKMLLNAPHTDPKEAAIDTERFIREARLSASLPKHPGIVGVYESGTLENRRYIAMEYIDGCTLSDWYAKSTGSLRGQVAVLRDAALAVDHANRHGIVHRDLKPANVLVDTNGRPHVTDFGLAKQIRQDASLTLTGGGKVMGTPTYISPEQAAGRKDVDRRTDVWALGIMLYEMLAGRPPFRGETPIDIMMKAAQNPVPPPSTVVREGPHRSFDRNIENICLKALVKEPSHRYPTAKAFAEDLSRWLKGETIVVKMAEPPKRSPLPWVAAGVLAAVAIGLLMMTKPPSADKIAAQKRDRAIERVAQGQRLLAQGRAEEALTVFEEAGTLDPDNRAASMGVREAERRIAASRQPPPERPAPPVAPAPPSGQALVRKAQDFGRVNPKDIEGQIRVWQEARNAAGGTPYEAEAVRELQAALGRRRQAVASELSELDHAVEALREAESFGPAREILNQASKRHDEPEWVAAIRARQEDLQKVVTALFGPVRDRALDAKRRDDRKTVETQRANVARWRWPELTVELEDALAKVVPAPPPPPPAAEPARLSGVPELNSLQGHGNGVRAVAFSPDGKLLISTSFDQTVRLWDLASRRERTKLLEGVDVPSVAFSPDGKWMAAGSTDGTIRLWDPAKPQPRSLSGHTLQAIGLAFSPDAKLLASASTDGSVRLWDPVSGSQKGVLEGHSKGAMSVSWSPDGKILAVACADGQLRLWDMPAGRERRTLGEGNETPIWSVAFCADGKSVVTAGRDPRFSVWDIDSGRRRFLSGHSKEIRGIACSPDGHWIASASADGTLRLWDAASGEVRASFNDPGSFFGAVFSRKGDLLAGCAGGWNVRLWDIAALRVARSDSK